MKTFAVRVPLTPRASISGNGPTFAVKTHVRVLSDRASLGQSGRLSNVCAFRCRDLRRNDVRWVFLRGYGRVRHRLRVRLCWSAYRQWRTHSAEWSHSGASHAAF